MAFAAPRPALRPYVREYVGWWEQWATPICRREVPSEVVPLIINFGAPVRMFRQHDPVRADDFGSFTTGVYDTYALVGTSGALSGGVQCNFTIPGARLFLDQPLRELVNRPIALEDLFGRDARRLDSELYDAPTWSARFAILDREIAARLVRARQLPRALVGAWTRLVATGGRAGIAALAGEVGCSQKHLVAMFNEHFGVPPKTVARVLRFGRAIQRIKDGPVKLADLALDCGYYDQAHFDRDFRAFAGVTPTDLVRSVMPDTGGFAADR